MPWKLPSGQPHQDGQTAGDADQLYFERHMARVVASSRAAAGANVCLIIDPSNGEVIAEASDCTALHPLRHAVMEAVAAAAERDLRLWPVNGFVHLGRQEDTSVHGVNTIVDGANGGGGGGGANGELVVSNGAASGSASGDDEGTGRPAAQEQPQEQAAERPEQQHSPPPPPPQQQQQQQQAQQQQHEDHLLSGLKHCHSQEDGLGVDSPAKRQRVTNGFASHSKPCSSTSKAGGGEEQPVGAAVADEVQQQQGEQQQETQQQEEERQPLPPLPPQQQQPQEGRQERQQQSDGPAPANNPVSVPQEQPKRPASASPSADGGAGAEVGSSGNSASGGASGLSRLPTPVPITSWANKPYLCNTYDAFLLREPCAMCGMALVHSRLARVVYCEADGRHGALGGAFRLQANRSLNHHYDVFHMPAERRSSKAAGGKAAAKAAAAMAVVAAATAAAAAPGVA
ncbi:hypothetical protein MNEG_4032 [Monoraphidium neglectum]|uniref:CMP/dCMP-type deaminase domain-containing protein n=1 Tax=Monoraphidium neglectum TaxID=145388 RepID=A0A0D2MTW1_9CHLO|nr:hypothetical protein MNEG_4032 [Monoraphidium neglectum]KIZ03932.1 hypothetical protein MNEG_4032 [Monoraphidium neglectum]|eukprot:XP_013902951.1 hypothetical protein MNEG_4032 [Monoraphidium neglectum]